MKISGKICPVRSVGKSIMSTGHAPEPVYPGWPSPPVMGGGGYSSNPIVMDNIVFCSPACAWFDTKEVDGEVVSERCMAWPTKGDE